MSLQKYLHEKRRAVNACLNQLIPAPDGGREDLLHESMLYSINAGGKRLRPILFLVALEGFGMKQMDFLPFACGLEMIHTYSLIHDDLPAMDDDDLRRGKPTCHKVFGEAQAILAGDALLTYAFNAMLQVRPFVNAELLLNAVDEAAYQAGIGGMIAGQSADIAYSGNRLSVADLQYIYEKKTGALFTAAVVSAAILANASKREIESLRVYAMSLGRAYQISDDVLDIVGSESEMGKNTGQDAKNNKTTYPSLLGLSQAVSLSEAAAQEALEALDGFNVGFNILRELPFYFLHKE